MGTDLKGHKNRRKRALSAWLKMKELYDAGETVDTILKKVKKENGQSYSRSYFYVAMHKLNTL